MEDTTFCSVQKVIRQCLKLSVAEDTTFYCVSKVIRAHITLVDNEMHVDLDCAAIATVRLPGFVATENDSGAKTADKAEDRSTHPTYGYSLSDIHSDG